ncbi:DNA mismatch repair protein [Arachidicoccus ginsenosidimutans]|uniref:MutS-related protein n=1 Tax=Arachidicoccus sp. BS20 TaxID=1850526 RepID=UPI0007F106E5|nr:DNA mismatch repair protein [Arachidicoccus sp. BS20]ANI88193.1 DNA mismatch repair protein [Arachidicoccus sp. BS20]
MFITDAQTLNDIGIFSKSSGIYALYSRTITRGGERVLEEMLCYPLSDVEKINQRTGIIQNFSSKGIEFPFNREFFDAIEQYLSERDERTRLIAQQRSLSQKLSGLIAKDVQFKNIVKGINTLTELLFQLKLFVHSEAAVHNQDYAEERERINTLLSEPAFAPILSGHSKKLSQEQLVTYDSILRFRHHTEVRELLQFVYNLDAYISIGQTARECGFCFAIAADNTTDTSVLHLEYVWHPIVMNAIGNDIIIDSEKNVVFLTGANMAGKSTFMKSVSIAVYLAHCGFPVAAKAMRFTIMDGMFSTINLPDNLGMGASHFYAEVLRVKKIAQELHAGKRLFVLFDEMFRGTNVKDAGEATITIVEGFAKKTNSLFIISTHIIEAGDVLRQKTDNIQYCFLPTTMQGHKPVYTYKLEHGITADRHGMIIIRNEGILEMLEKNVVNKNIH